MRVRIPNSSQRFNQWFSHLVRFFALERLPYSEACRWLRKMSRTSSPTSSGRRERQLSFQQLSERVLLAADGFGVEAGENAIEQMADMNLITINDRQASASEVLVRFRPDASIRTLQEGLAIAPALESDLRLIEVAEDSTVAETIAHFENRTDVAYVEPNYVVSIDELTVDPIDVSAIPNDPRFAELWGMHNTGQLGGAVDVDIDLPEAHDISAGGETVIVAIIDTGIDYRHEDLRDQMWINTDEIPGNGIDDDQNGYVDDIYGVDFYTDDSDPMDLHGHGTHVAGTIGATGNNSLGVAGVNFNVKFMAAQFLGPNGSGYISDAVQALNYVVVNGALVSNNSWGGGGESQAFAEALTAAQDAGHIFIASAGNSSNDNDQRPAYPATYPHDNIISVAAIDRFGDRAGFSSFGKTTVDIGAPGVDVLSLNPNNSYVSWSGTSMAAPHVTGVVSLVMGLHPEWSYQQVIERVLSTAEPLASMDGITVTGGMVNAHNAIRSDGDAAITGLVFEDVDGDGQRDPGEDGIGNWEVYVDLNESGTPDDGDVFTRTNADGSYRIEGLAAGSYWVRNELRPGWRQTSPSGSAGEKTAYFMTSGNAETDNASIAALESSGFDVTMGAGMSEFDGSQVDVNEFGLVVLTNNHNWGGASMPTSGQQALNDYFQAGGDFVFSEWVTWNINSAQRHTGLDPILPSREAGFSGNSSTTYSLATTDPIITEGLPAEFTLDMTSLGGTETVMETKAGATVFVNSSNTSAPGAVGWQQGQSRVAGLSTLATSVELSNAHYATLYGNLAEWAVAGGTLGAHHVTLSADETAADLDFGNQMESQQEGRVVTVGDLTAGPGEVATGAIRIDDLDDATAIDLRMTYDTTLLDVNNSDVRLGQDTSNWTLVTNVDDASGSITVSMFSTNAEGPGPGEVLEVDFHVKSSAGVGDSSVLRFSRFDVNEGAIDTAPVDGSLTVTPGVFSVTRMESNSSGVDVRFSEAFDPAPLNLYRGQTSGGDADLTLIGQQVGELQGTLVLHDDHQGVSFIADGGAIPDDDYRLVLNSGFGALLALMQNR